MAEIIELMKPYKRYRMRFILQAVDDDGRPGVLVCHTEFLAEDRAVSWARIVAKVLECRSCEVWVEVPESWSKEQLVVEF
jgi:hypothetical protein